MPFIITHESDCSLVTEAPTIHPNVCTCGGTPIDTDTFRPLLPPRPPAPNITPQIAKAILDHMNSTGHIGQLMEAK